MLKTHQFIALKALLGLGCLTLTSTVAHGVALREVTKIPVYDTQKIATQTRVSHTCGVNPSEPCYLLVVGKFGDYQRAFTQVADLGPAFPMAQIVRNEDLQCKGAGLFRKPSAKRSRWGKYLLIHSQDVYSAQGALAESERVREYLAPGTSVEFLELPALTPSFDDFASKNCIAAL